MYEKTRSFLAFPINNDLKNKLKEILKDLRDSKADVKWVRLENIHLTLKFLGDLKEDELEAVQAVIREQYQGFHPITTILNKIGTFPGMRHPKIIWVGLEDSHQEIQRIVEIL